MSLPRELLKLAKDAPLGFAIGIVTDTSPLTVQINGDSVDIADPPSLDSYAPAVDDVVFVLRPGPTVLVVGKIA